MGPRVAFIEDELRRKEQLINATYAEVVQKGFSAVTLQDVAERAGVSKGTTLYYFKTKEDLFLAVFEWLVGKIGHKMETAISGEKTAVAKLRAALDSIFVSEQRNEDFYRAYLDFLGLATRDKRYTKLAQVFFEHCSRIDAEIIRQGIKEGTFKKQAPEKAAAGIRALIDGLSTRWLFEGGDFDEFKQDAIGAVMSLVLKN